jgi:alkaline phosphatase
MRCFRLSFLLSRACLVLTLSVANADPVNSDDWYQQGNDWLQKKIIALTSPYQGNDDQQAKNIILFLGDGMSITTLTAARIWQGQQQGGLGEEHFLHFETFPHTALIKTYNTNQQTPDSAGTMSAIMTGVKTRAGLISMGPEQNRGDCKGSQQHHQQTLLEWGHLEGFDTGVVTTARLTHATPAATYAHSPERYWEGDYTRYPNAYWYGCDSIAKQLIHSAFPAGLDLALGGGAANLEGYYADFEQEFPQGRLLTNRQELEGLIVNSSESDYEQKAIPGPILGVFSSSHLAYEANRTKKQSAKQPTLLQMTEKSIQYFQSRPGGYLLVIEGARIDHAHHKGNAARALAETSSLANAVKLADDMTADEDTLIIVTADHSHTFTMAGYPKRGNPILGVSKNQKDETVLANDGLPYSTLGYANGKTHGRQFNENDQHHSTSEALDFHQGVAVTLDDETHGSDDVALHAKGPGSYLFSGLMEQHEIFHTMLQALTSTATPRESQNGVLNDTESSAEVEAVK